MNSRWMLKTQGDNCSYYLMDLSGAVSTITHIPKSMVQVNATFSYCFAKERMFLYEKNKSLLQIDKTISLLIFCALKMLFFSIYSSRFGYEPMGSF